MEPLAALCVAFASVPLLAAPDELEPAFARHELSNVFFCEGATFADFNRDGKGDVAAGPYWYEGPDFGKRHELDVPQPVDPLKYSENFFAFPHDFDRDGWIDLFFIAFPGKQAWWARNPQGRSLQGQGNQQHWEKHVVFPEVSGESPTFVDVNRDGLPDLVGAANRRWGYSTFDPAEPAKPWLFHPISGDMGVDRFTHGMGVGDVNGDGRPDLLERTGWWEQPASLAGDPVWKKHELVFSAGHGGAQMYTDDVDGDGDADVITSLNGHGWGLSWFEQQPPAAAGGSPGFVEHRLMGEPAEPNPWNLHFSELHALDHSDIDGDGLKDIVTGKRYWAHGPEGSPGAGDPAVLYWWKLKRSGGTATFEPHHIDHQSGVGVQVVAGDIDGDGKADVVVGNKKGTFVFLQRGTRPVVKPGPNGAPAAPTQPGGSGGAASSSGPLEARERGALPVGLDGRPLNTDFETGDLRDWTAEGDAFRGQPVRGDAPKKRQRESSRHAGDFWIGGYELSGDDPQGRLVSAPFFVTKPWASFLVAGGAHDRTTVELLRDGETAAFYRCSGAHFESLQPIAVDLRGALGRTIRIRLVDAMGGHWGHINFDDFRLHDREPRCERPADVPEIFPPDPVVAAGLPAADAARAMTVPPGFRVDVVAAEPQVHQPIAIALDHKARLWIVEAFTYPNRAKEGEGKDDIVVFEDRDHDGSFETRTVFMERLNLVSGIEVGFGGVWIGAAPYLMFVPDRNDDLKPDGPPEILLDGWGWQDTHETLNAFNWGPDGWLYGCHGVFTHSRVGKPGTPDDQRVPLNAAIWRYQPQQHRFELFSEGTSNPWGVDFDDRGDSFCTACVIPHLYQVIDGGRYIRQAGGPFNPHTYVEIDTIADHRHYAGHDPYAGIGRSATKGGGHAHCGAVIYLGDSFPDEYRNALLMGNMHGNRMNDDRFEAKGSGYVGRHAPDFLIANDKWFRSIHAKYGPDGSLYMIDWYDPRTCHDTREDVWDRTNGRIYRVSYGAPKPAAVDVAAMGYDELVVLQLHENDWWVRQARKELQRRAARVDETVGPLHSLLRTHPDATRRLRAMWALHAIGSFTERVALDCFKDPDAHVRGWAIQLTTEDGAWAPAIQNAIEVLAAEDPSPVVRRFIASALQRVSLDVRWDALLSLLQHAEDEGDPNLPALYWYALEPLVPAYPVRALKLAASKHDCRLPALRRFIVRRAAAEPKCHAELVAMLGGIHDAGEARWVLEEMHVALAEQRGLAMPQQWPAVSHRLKQDPELARAALDVAIDFGDRTALRELRAVVADRGADLAWRERALNALVQLQDAPAAAILHGLLDDAAFRGPVIRALANFADEATAPALIANYGHFNPDQRRDALTTLATRVGSAQALLAAYARGEIPKGDLAATVLRRLRDLQDGEVDRLLTEHYGVFRDTPDEKTKRIAELKAALTPETLAQGDKVHGRALYATTCMKCHVLFGSGKPIAPELTGANRGDLDYLLTNMIDPNALIGRDYQVTNVWLKNGNLVSGMLTRENASALTLIAENETVVVARSDVDSQKLSATSLMPEGQLDALAPDEIRDLVAYLQSPAQVPMRASDATLPYFFDGRSLAFWTGDPALWSGANGEIVGLAPQGLPHNAFLFSDLELADFKLTLEVKLTPNEANSGIQFRSAPFEGGEAKGLQADIGVGWWGKLYEESGRALLEDVDAAQWIRPGDWNRYEITATGTRIRLALNGHVTVDRDDPVAARRGQIALQIHSGGPTDVRFRNLQLELDPPALPPVANSNARGKSGS